MTLIEPVDVPAVAELGAVHFIAVGGAGMSGVAALFADRGVSVSGSDQQDSATLRRLAARGVRVFAGHRPDQLGQAETVVVSSAIGPDNVELAAARRRGLRVLHRSTALAALMRGQRGIAVSGTHGKTTTTAMIITALTGLNPSWVVGAELQQGASGAGLHGAAQLGTGDVFVVEADESDASFLQYPAEVVVVTNVEADHLDNWHTPQAYRDGFARFVSGAAVRTVVINVDDPGAAEVAAKVAGEDLRVITVGENSRADLVISDIRLDATVSSAQLRYDGTGGQLRLPVPGRHNLHNAAAAYAVARSLDLGDEEARVRLATFAGTTRRFQLVGDQAGVRVFDDYAHNPAKVRAAVQSGRQISAGGRLIVVFQPHLYSRTRDFAAEFGAALSLADAVVVMDVYGAREQPIEGVSGQLIAEAVVNAEVSFVPAAASVPGIAAGLAAAGDIIMTVGAGDVTGLGPKIVSLLDERAGAGTRAGSQP